MKLKLKIIDLDGIYLDKEVDLLNIFTDAGNITILAGHLPIISNIQISHLYIKDNGTSTYYAIAGGTLFVDENECKILTTAIESKEDIDLERAKKAKERAEERLQSKDSELDIKRAEIALKRAINRISLKEL